MSPFRIFGEEIDEAAINQMKNAIELPISKAGALMPDAHVGYGLPIGGVLATKDAVIPYAVGVDIGCRVKVSIYEETPRTLDRYLDSFSRALEKETYFGIGAVREKRADHSVMERDWGSVSYLKDTAWKQLGTSGSGNHFVEFGELEILDHSFLKEGTYIALVSHSGSRGAGARVCDYFSKLATKINPKFGHLAWLDMKEEGAEYWEAMEIMGEYASANHEIIHRDISKHLKIKPIFTVENHHNFAWKEEINEEELIVHRKGATPAKEGELGYIPGTMIDPGYVVKGKGEPTSIFSSAHGAGRRMSRNQARNSTTKSELRKVTEGARVNVLSCGLDESPFAYKDINKVMEAQSSLVNVLAKFTPRIVKMAPDGERAED